MWKLKKAIVLGIATSLIAINTSFALPSVEQLYSNEVYFPKHGLIHTSLKNSREVLAFKLEKDNEIQWLMNIYQNEKKKEQYDIVLTALKPKGLIGVQFGFYMELRYTDNKLHVHKRYLEELKKITGKKNFPESDMLVLSEGELIESIKGLLVYLEENENYLMDDLLPLIRFLAENEMTGEPEVLHHGKEVEGLCSYCAKFGENKLYLRYTEKSLQPIFDDLEKVLQEHTKKKKGE